MGGTGDVGRGGGGDAVGGVWGGGGGRPTLLPCPAAVPLAVMYSMFAESLTSTCFANGRVERSTTRR